MTSWIDEFGDEFGSEVGRLSDSIDGGVCGDRILNLMGGACRKFYEDVNNLHGVYRKVLETLQRHAERRPDAADGINDVRDQYRGYGNTDGIRHCVLASAIHAGLERAVSVFMMDLEPVRRKLLVRFGDKMGFETAEDIWQNETTEIVLEKIKTFEGKGVLSSWTETIVARAMVRKFVRTGKSEVSLDKIALDPVSKPDVNIEDSDAEEIKKAWTTAWAELTDREMAILRHCGAGMQNKDVARLLGLHPGRVTRLRQEAIEKFRTALLALGQSRESLAPFIGQLLAKPGPEVKP